MGIFILVKEFIELCLIHNSCVETEMRVHVIEMIFFCDENDWMVSWWNLMGMKE